MELSPISPIPDHVPDSLVYDFDYVGDPSMREDVHHGALRIAREAPRIFWTPRQGGHWVVAGYRATNDITRDPATFSNAALQIPAEGPTDPMFPITLDPPEHGKYRAVLERAFSPRAMKAMETSITAFANRLIDEVLAKGGCDFVPAVSEPLPVQVFMKMMGLPLDRFGEFRGWVVEMFSSGDIRRKQYLVGRILEATGELIMQRERQPKDDLISTFIGTRIDGERLTFDQVQAFCLMVFLAGLDTVTNGMSFGIYQLALDQELQARLRMEPSFIPQAAEELLRRRTFTLPSRTVTRDVTYGAVSFRKGDLILLMLPAADLDPEAFDDPGAFALRRKRPPVSFNSGIHRCVGMHLARVELHALYREWLRRVPPFAVAGPVRMHAGRVLAMESLPLSW